AHTTAYPPPLHDALPISRGNPLHYRVFPDGPMESYTTGAGINRLTETISTNKYKSFNAFANYKDKFGDGHNLTAVGGFNYETRHTKRSEEHTSELQSRENLVCRLLLEKKKKKKKDK